MRNIRTVNGIADRGAGQDAGTSQPLGEAPSSVRSANPSPARQRRPPPVTVITLSGDLAGMAVRALATALAEVAAAGFGYGLRRRPQPYAQAGHLAFAAADPFEFCELAVRPSARGLGAGRALHDAIVEASGPQPRWLVTHPEGADGRDSRNSAAGHALRRRRPPPAVRPGELV
jgi:GNAT superfamily N-acetyltransferase